MGIVNGFIQDGFPIIALILAIVALVLYIWPAMRLLTRTVYHDKWLGRTRALIRVISFLAHVPRASLFRAACMWSEVELLNPRPDPPDPYKLPPGTEFRAELGKYKTNRRKWLREARHGLGDLMDSSLDNPATITVPTCFDIYRAEEDIKRYFAVRHHHRPAVDRKPNEFQSRILVKEGFVAPLHLLGGLLSHAEEEWSQIIEKYGKEMVHQPDPLRNENIRALQTFMFNCWLLWGPSIPICIGDDHLADPEHVQFGYGDEDNSIALTINQPRTGQPFPLELGQNGGSPTIVRHVSATGRIRQQQDKTGELRLVLAADSVGPPITTQPGVRRRYYSAYIWIIFVICDQHGQPLESVQWRNMLTYFEHGNLAEEYTFQAIKHQLAEKARYSIEQLLDEQPDITIRYACAIDDSGCGEKILHPPSPDNSIVDIIFEGNWAAKFGQLGGVPRVSKDIPADGSYASCHLPEIVTAYLDADGKAKS